METQTFVTSKSTEANKLEFLSMMHYRASNYPGFISLLLSDWIEEKVEDSGELF